MMDPIEKIRTAARAVREAIPELPGWLEGANQNNQIAQHLLDAGSFAAAEEHIAKNLSDFRARSMLGARHAKTLLALATSQLNQKKTGEARAAAEEARALLGGASARPSATLAASLELLGRIALEEGDADGAVRLFREALETQETVRPVEPAALIRMRRGLAGAQDRSENLAGAAENLREAVAIAEKQLGPANQITAECLAELGQVQSRCEEHAAAIESLGRAAQIHQELCGLDAEEVARDFQALAVASQAAGDLEQAVTYYEKALRVRERQLGGNAVEFASVLMSLAGVHSDLGSYAPAVEYLQQAVGRLDAVHDHHLGYALEGLGAAYVQFGRFDDAVSCIRRARNIWEEAPEDHAQALESNQELLNEVMAYVTVRQPQESPAARGVPGPAMTSGRAALVRDAVQTPQTGTAPTGWSGGGFMERSAETQEAPAAPAVLSAPRGAPGGITLNFVRPDGSAADAGAVVPSNGPVHLTILVGEGKLASSATAVTLPTPETEDGASELSGWDELSFDVLAR